MCNQLSVYPTVPLSSVGCESARLICANLVKISVMSYRSQEKLSQIYGENMQSIQDFTCIKVSEPRTILLGQFVVIGNTVLQA